MKIAKQMELIMKSGETLTLDMSDALLEKICESFSLGSVDQITERHVKYYLVSAMKKTLEFDNGKSTY
jgi:hypothetical protein